MLARRDAGERARRRCGSSRPTPASSPAMASASARSSWCATSSPTGASCRCWSICWRPSRPAASRRRRSPTPPGGMADALLGIAEALHQERGAARSIVYARLALFLQPDLAEASLLIADILAEQDNLEGAIAAYEAVERRLAARRDRQACAWRARCTRSSGARRRSSCSRTLADAEPERTEALVAARRSRAPRRGVCARREGLQRGDRAHPGAAARALDAVSTRAASPTSAPSAGRRPRPTSCRRSSSSPSSPTCSTISATAGSTMGMNLDQAKGDAQPGGRAQAERRLRGRQPGLGLLPPRRVRATRSISSSARSSSSPAIR